MENDHYKKILMSGPLGYSYNKIIFNDNGYPIDFVFIEVNPAFELMTGLDKDYIINRKASDVIPNFIIKHYSWFEDFYYQTSNDNVYEHYVESTKKWFQVNIIFNENKDHFSTEHVDITKQKEQSLELERFFSVNLDLLCIADTDGNFIKTNEAWSRILGYSQEELSKRKFLDFIHPDDLANTYDAIDLLLKQEEVYNFTNRYLTKDGSYRYIEWRSHPFGKLIYAAARDITESIMIIDSLFDAQQLLTLILDTIPIRVFWKDINSVYLGCNSSFVNDTGLDNTAEVIGKTDFDFFWKEHALTYQKDDKYVIETGQKKLSYEQVQKTYNGYKRILLSNKLPLTNKQEQIIGVIATYEDITEKKKIEVYRDLNSQLLVEINEQKEISTILTNVVSLIKEKTDCDAVAIRLKNDNDFPYFVNTGFSDDFINKENFVNSHNSDIDFCELNFGDIKLDCTCGLVLSGRINTDSPFGTSYGSFFTNNSPSLLNLSKEEDKRYNPRNTCIHCGYNSFALIPIKNRDTIIGLLQLNHKVKNSFTPVIIQLLEDIASHIGEAIVRKFTEDTIRESEEKYRLLVESAIEAIIILQDYKLKYFNPVFNEITGYSSEDLYKITLFDIIYYEDRDLVNTNYTKRINNLPVPRKYEFRLLQKNNEYRWVEISGVRIFWNGKPANFNFINDIHDRKLAEMQLNLRNEELRLSKEVIESNLYQKTCLIEELEQTKDQLENAIGEKDKFFSIIAHDLKSPFSAFLNLTEILADEITTLSVEEIHEFAFNLKKSANHLFKLLENLLEWARMQRGLTKFEPESFNLAYIVQNNFDILADRIQQKDIKAISNISADTIVYADINMLNTIIRNILSNALKFTPNNGIVTVEHTQEFNYNKISIKDTGIGIPESYIPKLFILGEKTSRLGTQGESSTGLGLHLCKEYVEKHKGRIWVESIENEGSTFHFTLPVFQ